MENDQSTPPPSCPGIPEWVPRRIDAAHEQIRALSLDVSGLRAGHEAQERRITLIDQRTAEDHGILVDLKLTVHALSAGVTALSSGIASIRAGQEVQDRRQDELHALIRTHTTEETIHVESIARKITRAGAVGVLLLICALAILRVVPSTGLPGLLTLFGAGP